MRTLIICLLLVLTGILGTSFKGGNTGGITISVKPGEFKINNVKVNAAWSLQDVKATLGEPDRVRVGYNKTHTYDRYGIVLFERVNNNVPTGVIAEVQVFLAPPVDKNEVVPTGIFTGVCKFNGKVYGSNDVNKGMLSKIFKKWTSTDSYIEHSFRYAAGGLYAYSQLDATESQLIKFSVGPDKK